ncbi:UTRA domain-containing protein [Nonomuraea sp. PA05]|uniref:UTRA domain-containing protein n=1 Tax=Nonomuraea sp. PA05 TaxID=2604466 RepID=UPI001651D409|nr:UTRA domain-containing protein [Nonomuraea sp. PA05]
MRGARGCWHSWRRATSTGGEIILAGRRPSAQLIRAEERPPTSSAKEALGLAGDETDHEPIALETTYFPSALTPGLLEQPLTGSLWHILRTRYAVVPTDRRRRHPVHRHRRRLLRPAQGPQRLQRHPAHPADP